MPGRSIVASKEATAVRLAAHIAHDPGSFEVAQAIVGVPCQSILRPWVALRHS